MSGFFSQGNSSDAWNFLDGGEADEGSPQSASSAMARVATPLSYDKMSKSDLLVHVGELNVKLENYRTEANFQEGRIKTINQNHEEQIADLRYQLLEQTKVNVAMDRQLYNQRARINQLEGNYNLDSHHHLLPTHHKDGKPVNTVMRQKAQKSVRIVEPTVVPPPKKGLSVVGVTKKGISVMELDASTDDEDEVLAGVADLRRLADKHKK